MSLMTLNGHTYSTSEYKCFPEHLETENEDINPYYQRRRCSPMTIVSGKYRPKVYANKLRGFPGEGVSNDGVIENVGFQCF